MKRLRFHPEARAELRAATEFYEQETPNLGRELVRELKAVLSRVTEWPESGFPGEGDTRRVILARFPFSVVYRLREDEIEVIAFMHQRQKPDYWRER